jgi:hypothetical protein
VVPSDTRCANVPPVTVITLSFIAATFILAGIKLPTTNWPICMSLLLAVNII